jgi:hypothetical protein
VYHKGQRLSEPYVVTVAVSSRSDRDIDRDSFDGKPLELRFGVPIIELLESNADAQRAAVRTPQVAITEATLEIGPALITRRHQLSYVVLVDGKPSFRPVGDLVNVTIKVGEASDRRSTDATRRSMWKILRYSLLVVAGSAAIFIMKVSALFVLAGALSFLGARTWKKNKQLKSTQPDEITRRDSEGADLRVLPPGEGGG